MADALQPGFVLIRLEASCQSDCILEHDSALVQTEPVGRKLNIGGAGTILQTHETMEVFGIGDVVVACLSDEDISTDSHGQQVARVNFRLLSKLHIEASRSTAARIPMAFAIATAILHKTGFLSFPLSPTIDQQVPPRNILFVARDTVVPLVVIKLLRLYTVTTVFVVYEAETIAGPISIDPAMIAGAHFAQQPSSTSILGEVARGLRSNLGHYGPYSGTGCFDLILDLTEKAVTPEPYRRLLCPDTGILFQLPQTFYVDFESLFVENYITAGLETLLEDGEINAENLYVHS